ncbi:MAG: OB-fold nucleic acid binding domain-containing protein [Planctomycetes bacterium]|nr:OB-fold nucleic acid binding domain-containing protein [Planctomycetota bacterium]
MSPRLSKWIALGIGILLVGGALCIPLRGAQPPGPRLRAPADAETTSVRGRIEKFTTPPRGEVDGAVLDDGTWLHWPPHLQDRFADILKEGDRVRATGRTETGPAGDTHFEVQSVTNLRNNATAENPDFADGPPPSPPGVRRVAPGRSADRDQRLRDLEDQVDQLRREIRRLRRER